MAAISPEEHCEAVQSLFTLDEAVFEDLKELKGDRAALGGRILTLMLNNSQVAAKKSIADETALKKALSATKSHKDVKGAQTMLLQMIGIPEAEPPKMLGVLWCL